MSKTEPEIPHRSCLNTPRKSSSHGILLPTCWNAKDKYQLLALSHDNRRIAYIGEGKTNADAACVRAEKPISPSCGVFYYEVTIIDRGREGFIGIGWATRTVSLNRLPGWDRNSYGYHGDDGNGFRESGSGSQYGPTFTTGDVIGCGVNFIRSEMFYTKNGLYLGPAFKNVTFKHSLFPCVGLRTKEEVVETNFGQDPYMFDIDSYYDEERNLIKKKCDEQVLDSSPFNSLVLSYLKHSGYRKTTEAFCKAVDIKLADTEMESMDNRQKICSYVKEGKAKDAVTLLQQLYPGILSSSQIPLSVKLLLLEQIFIELIRDGDVEGAIAYGKVELAPYVVPGGLNGEAAGSSNMSVSVNMNINIKGVRADLQDVLSLVAFDNPESYSIGASLLSQARRDFVARALNTAIVIYDGGKPKADLESFLKHGRVCVSALQLMDVGASACLSL